MNKVLELERPEIKIKIDSIKLVDVNKLKLNPENRNHHPQEQIDELARHYAVHGMRTPIIVSNLSGHIVSGNGRFLAAKRAGLSELPVSYQDFESPEKEYAFGIADNGLSLWSELDFTLINEDITDFGPDFNIDDLGLKDFTIDVADKYEDKDADEIPEVVEPKAKLGEIYKLGNHRLMCGDSTSESDVAKLMNGEFADITFTSPPYNAGKNIRGNFYENDSDDKSDDEYVNFLNKVTKNSISICKYVFINLQILESNKKAIIRYQHDNIEKLKDVLIWNKKQYPPHINKGTFGCKWEYVFAFGKEGKSMSFPCAWQGKFPNVIETENNSGNEFAENHKAGFPVSFPTWLIEKMDFTKSCFDPFMGTGTTMIACEKLGINSYGMELDPHYIDVIITRWEKFTGQKAELINV